MISEGAVASRALRAGLSLSSETVGALVAHARAVLAAEPGLHLTTVTDPAEFLERHIGESLEGAALLPPSASGLLVDVGSGNGYPGVPLGLVHPGLQVVLAEASKRKAGFLEDLAASLPGGKFSVLCSQVQRAEDLSGVAPEGAAFLASRAMGNWARVLPRLARVLSGGGRLLLWAGQDAEVIVRRQAWKVLQLVHRHPLAGRDRSWIWVLEKPPTV